MRRRLVLVIYFVGMVFGRIMDEPTINQVAVNAGPEPSPQPVPAAVPTSKSAPPAGPCFYAEPELCTAPPLPGATHGLPSTCDCFVHPTVPRSLVCCNITDIGRVYDCGTTDNTSTPWANVHIRNATFDKLDVSNKFWKLMESIAVTDGRIKSLIDEFRKFSAPKCLNVSNNNLSEFSLRAVHRVSSLQMLDISHNNLSTMPNVANRSNQTNQRITIDICGNAAMLCKSVLDIMDRPAVTFADLDRAFCLTNQTFNWFNSTDSVPLRQIERMHNLRSECPESCSCKAERMNYEDTEESGSHLVFTAQVNCAYTNRRELPEKLPNNTLALNVTGNNITSLAALNYDSYKHLLRLYADDNQIESILDLEGTPFLKDFDRLYLRRNKLKSIPIYILSNTLDRNPSGRQVYLEGNYLHCDCNSAKVLRLWLLARQNHITDYDQILCDNMALKVFELSETKLCQSQHDWTDYIYYLIGAEVFLLLALVFKVTYDYWVFKTSGYLPWPASKMPKLPCDWLCES